MLNSMLNAYIYKMKYVVIILLFGFNSLVLSQNETKKEFFKNGNLKSIHTIENGNFITKTYYKNGQLHFHENKMHDNTLIEEFYKNGQLNYQKTTSKFETKEKFFSKQGDLVIVLINGKVEFVAYDGALEEFRRNNTVNYPEENHHGHGHHHSHGHHHGHGHHH